MKRIVICYDGTWNSLTNPEEVTNVVKVAQAIKSVSSDGITQMVFYSAGVGSGGPIDRVVGGIFGAGLRDNVKRGLAFLSLNWDPEETGYPIADEIYIFGFSRGAYTARALAGVIGAIKGIPKHSKFEELETVWNHYRASDRKRKRDEKQIAELIYPMPADKPIIKCVAVWDTVGRYGIPSGLGLGGLARQATAWTRGFRDTSIGRHIEVGLHAMAIDERRRAFSATAWVADGETDRPGVVEQVWFAGAHSNIGGGYRRAGLSDLALIWMIARVGDLTGLEFDDEYVRDHFWPCAACSLYRSSRGLLGLLSRLRPIPEAIRAAGQAIAPARITGRLLNAKVHWSVKDRLGRIGLVDETRYRKYRPRNLPKHFDVAERAEREQQLIDLCRGAERDKRKACALHCDLLDTGRGWRGWWRGWRTRRFLRLRKNWEDINREHA